MNTRRRFVFGALSAATLASAQARYAPRLRFNNDGQVSFDFVRWNPFITPPPDFSGLPPNAEVRVRNIFLIGTGRHRDVVCIKLPNNSECRSH